VDQTTKNNDPVGAQQSPIVSALDAPIQGDRRQVTIIFADISGFTALNDAAKTPAEVEQVVRLINLLLGELSEAIYEYDGYIDKYVGDEIMALFGAPAAHENDPELALRAALAMMERLKKFNENPPMPLPAPLGIHMGINTGTVIACMVGTGRKSSYTVMGDAVNIAARLEAASERGQIFVHEDTYNLTNRLFIFEECEPILVKGKPEPLKIYELKGARDLSQTQRGLTGMEAPLIGREDDVQQLLNRYHKLSAKKGSIAVVAADAGLGKSRLIAEVLKQVNKEEKEEGKPKSLWLFGRGLSYRQSFANRLFVDILYSYLGLPENSDHALVKLKLEAMGEELFGRRKDEIIPYLAAMLGVKLDSATNIDLPLNEPQILQQRIFLAMGEWVETLAAKQPVVLVFEDLHWADPSSVALIEYLFNLTVFNPILIICVTRIERTTSFWKVKTQSAQEFTNLIEVTLWPLANEECRQLIKHLLKIEAMPKALEDLLLNRSEGNPLFLEEVLRSLIEEGAIAHRDGRWEITRSVREIDIPTTLQGVLTARIDRLEEPVRRSLQIAAVIGRVFPRFILAPIFNEPEVLEKALEQLEIADLIEVKTREPEPEYVFKHVLTYETAYHSMLHQQRQLIHKQIGDYMSRQYWLLGEEYAPIVAEHYYKSETWDRALRYFQRAAVAAIQSFANKEAVEFYTRALEVATIPDSKAEPATVLAIYEGRAKMYTRLGEPQKAMADYEAVLNIAKEINDDAAQMRALNGNGALQASHHNFSLASEYFQKALAVARRIGDGQGIADTLNQLGNFYYNMGELELATKCYGESRDLSKEANNELSRISAEDGLAKVMLEQGQITASLKEYQEEIIPICRRLGYRGSLISALYSVLVAHVFTANYTQAEQTAQELLELHKRFGDYYRTPLVKYYQALGQLYQGYLGEASKNLTEGLKIAQEQEQKSSQALGLAWLGYYYLTLGMKEEGLRQAEQSIQLAHELGSPLYEMKAQSILGAAYRHLNRLKEAVKTLENVHTEAQTMGFTADQVMILYQLTRAYIDTNQTEKAKKSVQGLLSLAKASEMHEFVARGGWLLSILETKAQRYEAALEALIQASDLAQEIDSRITQYLVQIQKAHVYQLTGNDAALRDALIYAQRIQKKLLENLPDEATQQIFLNNVHSIHLQEITQAISKKSA
jgi:predicted ATPase/class 3 adenylate cyclase